MEATSESKPVVTDEEMKFIKEEGGPFRRWIVGMLSSIRGSGRTVEEDFEDAVSDPNNSEHRKALEAAKDFLSAHSKRLGIDER